MHIEVTEETFYTIFKGESKIMIKADHTETHFYRNEECKQSGKKIWNYVSSKKHQYYLTDINA